MRFLLALLLLVPAFAQQPEPQPKADAPAPAPAASTPPAPSTEQWLTGSFDIGYRWVTDVHGNFQQYRSVVDLGEGPKLNGLDFTIIDPKKRLFDRLDANAYSWGGDPYNTAHVAARKLGVYDFDFDYRNIAYFNAVPSFANPLFPAGFDEQAFDIHRRNMSFQLDLRPGKRITPYLAFERNSGFGHGIDTWVQDANNEFAVPTMLRDSTNNYRGGIRFEFNRFHVTLEQGGTTFKDDDQSSFNGVNLGDRTTPVLGQPDVLFGLSQAYGIRGTSIYEKGLITVRPTNWLDIYGQFLYSQPKVDVNFTEIANGNFVQIAQLLFFNSQRTLGTGTANQPHTTGNVGFEVRPFRRLRIIESWMTDRYHDAEAPLTAITLLGSTTINPLNFSQIVNYNQQQIDVLFDLTSKLTLRGGYRYVWGDATVLAGQLSQSGIAEAGTLRRNIGLAGLTFRPSQKLSINLDYEGASGDRVYFRTSLNDYNKARVRARFQASNSLWFQANFQVLNNQNPSPDIRFDFQSRSNSLAVYWTPAGGKRFSITGEYDRSTVRSDIQILGVFFAPGVSSYRDNSHTASSAIDFLIPRWTGAKVTAGGSLFISSGSRPTRYYQPLARLSLPIQKHVNWNTEWRWYGFGEQFFQAEGFRTHTFMTGLRVTK